MCEGGEEMDQTFDANLAQREGEEPVERKVVGNWFICQPITILANCPYLIGTVPILTQEKVGKGAILPHVPIFEDFSPICSYFLGFRVGKYTLQKK